MWEPAMGGTSNQEEGGGFQTRTHERTCTHILTDV